jgi:hypothetical protein
MTVGSLGGLGLFLGGLPRFFACLGSSFFSFSFPFSLFFITFPPSLTPKPARKADSWLPIGGGIPRAGLLR